MSRSTRIAGSTASVGEPHLRRTTDQQPPYAAAGRVELGAGVEGGLEGAVAAGLAESQLGVVRPRARQQMVGEHADLALLQVGDQPGPVAPELRGLVGALGEED